MPYAAVTIAETLTLADYHAVSHHLGPRPVDGLMSEAAGCGDTGLHVITLWDSEADQKRFIAERLLPAFQAAGVQPGPLRFSGVDVQALYLRPEQPSHA
jgi:hypothetical protein